MSSANHPALLWASSFIDRDWSFGHVQALGPSRRLAGFSDFQLRLMLGRPPRRGAVVGASAFLSTAASRLLRSIGGCGVGPAAFAALRSKAALRFAAMAASMSGDSVAALSFFAAFRRNAASLLAAMRATASGVRAAVAKRHTAASVEEDGCECKRPPS